MAKYTMTLDELVSQVSSLWAFDMPKWKSLDPSLLANIQTGFVEYFRYYEIAQETIGRWLDRFHFWWNSLGEVYVEKFASYQNTQVRVIGNWFSEGSNDSVYSDTPVNELDPLTDYATNKTKGSYTETASHDQNDIDALNKYLDGLRLLQIELYEDIKEKLFFTLF